MYLQALYLWENCLNIDFLFLVFYNPHFVYATSGPRSLLHQLLTRWYYLYVKKKNGAKQLQQLHQLPLCNRRQQHHSQPTPFTGNFRLLWSNATINIPTYVRTFVCIFARLVGASKSFGIIRTFSIDRPKSTGWTSALQPRCAHIQSLPAVYLSHRGLQRLPNGSCEYDHKLALIL